MRRNTPQSSRISLWAFVIALVCLVCREIFIRDDNIEEATFTLHKWLEDNKLTFFIGTLKNIGITSFEQFLSLTPDELIKNSRLTAKQKKIITKKFQELQISNKALIKWLENNHMEKYLLGFYASGYADLKTVKEQMDEVKVKNIIKGLDGSLADYKRLIEAVKELKETPSVLLFLLYLPIQVIYFIFHVALVIIKWSFHLFFLAFFCASLKLLKERTMNCYHAILAQLPHHVTLLEYIFGNYLNASSCKVTWLWKDKTAVGKTAKFILKLCKKNPALGYEISGQENILIEVRNNEGAEEITKEQDFSTGRNAYGVTFHPKKAGNYTISILVNGENILGSPFNKTFLPGPVVISNIRILNVINMVVVQSGVYYPLKVEIRDKYNNLCEMENKDFFKVFVQQVGLSNRIIDPELVIFPEQGRNMLHIKVDEEGCFRSRVTYKDQPITNATFTIISLNESDTEILKKATIKNSWHQTWYEGSLLPSDYPSSELQSDVNNDVNDLLKKCRKVYFYFSSKQLTIKEFYLKFIPSRLYSFRLSPSTKIVLPEHDNPNFCHLELKLDDGIRPPVHFLSPKRSLIMATFARFLLRNIGNAESFQDKRRYFNNALQSHLGQTKFGIQIKKANVTVNRRNILESSYEATKNFSVSKWCKHFFVKFEGEEGYDAGGVTREWITILSTALFDPKNELFTQFNKDDKQALVYPNPTRPSHLKLKYYEFAGRIVGKCIFESSCGEGRRLSIKARFMRSFLAQLLGLRVNYKYFETDDKQLYTSKIQYIQTNDPKDLDLYFSEEEYDSNGKLVKELDIIPDGKTISVTQQNKMLYLDCLSQYRLSTRVSDEVNHFLKGLNYLVPDNLLVMFSEQELELLICGTSDISVSDLKKHHNLFSESLSFTKVMNWFWKTIALFSQEEIAQLVQFTTGSSQLPPGGFAHLTPTFSFTASPLNNTLPRAHTCFNQLVLPNYSTVEEFERCLRLAITEGCEGFGFQ